MDDQSPMCSSSQKPSIAWDMESPNTCKISPRSVVLPRPGSDSATTPAAGSVFLEEWGSNKRTKRHIRRPPKPNLYKAYGFSTTLETPEKSDTEFDDFDADEILSGIKLTPMLKNKDGTQLGKNDPATPDSKTSSLAKGRKIFKTPTIFKTCNRSAEPGKGLPRKLTAEFDNMRPGPSGTSKQNSNPVQDSTAKTVPNVAVSSGNQPNAQRRGPNSDFRTKTTLQVNSNNSWLSNKANTSQSSVQKPTQLAKDAIAAKRALALQRRAKSLSGVANKPIPSAISAVNSNNGLTLTNPISHQPRGLPLTKPHVQPNRGLPLTAPLAEPNREVALTKPQASLGKGPALSKPQPQPDKSELSTKPPVDSTKAVPGTKSDKSQDADDDGFSSSDEDIIRQADLFYASQHCSQNNSQSVNPISGPSTSHAANSSSQSGKQIANKPSQSRPQAPNNLSQSRPQLKTYASQLKEKKASQPVEQHVKPPEPNISQPNKEEEPVKQPSSDDGFSDSSLDEGSFDEILIDDAAIDAALAAKFDYNKDCHTPPREQTPSRKKQKLSLSLKKKR